MEQTKSKIPLLFSLGTLSILTPLAIDSYLPAFPTLADYFSRSISDIQLTLSFFLLAFAVGQLIYGPISDRFGRKIPLFIGLAIGVVSSFALSYTTNYYWFIAFRALQAIGFSGAVIISRAIVIDIFPPKEAANVFALLMLIFAVSPMLAPGVGSVILAHLEWQYIFIGIGIISLMAIPVTHFVLPPTKGPNPEVQLSRALHTYIEIFFKNKRFRRLVFISSGVMSVVFISISFLPAVVLKQYGGTSLVLSVVMAIFAASALAAPQFNPLLQKHFTMATIMRYATVLSLLGSVLFLVGLWFEVHPLVLLICQMLVGFGNGINMSLSGALALSGHGDNTGSASSLLGSMNGIFAFLAASAASILASYAPSWSAAAVMGISVFVVYLINMVLIFLPLGEFEKENAEFEH